MTYDVFPRIAVGGSNWVYGLEHEGDETFAREDGVLKGNLGSRPPIVWY